jgi:hypothetical protein
LFVVTNTDDSGTGSLRQAIEDANELPAGADTIDLTGVTGTITLTTGELQITDELTITGPGASLLTISGNDESRVININSNGSKVNISGLTIAGGNLVEGSGAGILVSAGTVTLDYMVIGGSQQGTNYAEGSGGGISNSGTITINHTSILGNVGSNSAGGILNAGTMTINSSTISGNFADTAGGGIRNTADGVLRINQSTVFGNVADDGGASTLSPERWISATAQSPVTLTG